MTKCDRHTHNSRLQLPHLQTIIQDLQDQSQTFATRRTHDPVKVWQTFKQVHENSGWANRMAMLREFVSLRMESEYDRMQDHLIKFNKLDTSLKDTGIELPDMLMMTILLASLHMRMLSQVLKVILNLNHTKTRKMARTCCMSILTM